MSECKPAASSTTPVSSCERIIADFQAQGAPSSSPNVQEGSVLGGFTIRTPRVGTGFIEWAVEGYDLEGKAPAAVTEPDYNKYGDWMYDKKVLPTVDGTRKDDENYRDGKARPPVGK